MNFNTVGIGRGKTKNNVKYWKALQNSSQDLPLYKDKPTNTHGNTKKDKVFRMAAKGLVVLLVFYLFYNVGKYMRHEINVPLESSNTADAPMNDWKFAQSEVKRVFKESWKHYEKDAWGKDVYHPLSHKGENMGPKPLGWIIVDSLDTLQLMDLEEEFKTASAWVENELTYDMDYQVNVFETTIRMLGGLLSAYYLSANDMFLDKAVDLADRLLGAFDSPSGIPYSSVNLRTKQGIKNHVDNGASSTAEVSTLQLEFKYLAKLTGEQMYWEKVEKIMKVLDDNHPKSGLAPIYVNTDTGKYQGNLIRLGSRGDSYYEYLLKQYLQTEEAEPIYNAMYQESVRGMKDKLLRTSRPNGLAFLGELEKGVGAPLSNKMDHLVCFIGGLFALGATEGETLRKARKSSNWNKLKEDDMLLAKDITHTCYEMYHQTATGLAPEIVVFNTAQDSTTDFIIKPLDKHNLQRPETVESLFILYRITGDVIYRRWGWEIFKSFEKYTKTPDGAYTSLDDVTVIPPKQADNMESFWLAETLKYLYLLFDDSNLTPLDEVVFNTEAHPFPKFSMNPLFKTGWQRSAVSQEEQEVIEQNPKEAKGNVRQPIGEKIEKKISSSGPLSNKKTLESEEANVNTPPQAAKPAKPAAEELEEVLELAGGVEEDEFANKEAMDESLAERLREGGIDRILEKVIDE